MRTFSRIKLGRTKASFLSSFLFLTAAGCSAQQGVCEQASQHISECLGFEVDSLFGEQCDADNAQGLLDMECGQVNEQFVGLGGDTKADRVSYFKFLKCWLNVIPISECYPEHYPGFETDFHAQRLVDGVPVPIEGIEVRITHMCIDGFQLNPSFTNGNGSAMVKVPGRHLANSTGGRNADPYVVEFFDGNELLFAAEHLPMNSDLGLGAYVLVLDGDQAQGYSVNRYGTYEDEAVYWTSPVYPYDPPIDEMHGFFEMTKPGVLEANKWVTCERTY